MALRLVSEGGLLNSQLIKEDPLILDTMKETDDNKARYGDVGDVYEDTDFHTETKYIRDSSPIAATNFDGTAPGGTYDDTILHAGTSGLGRYGINTLGTGGLGMVASLPSWADDEITRWHGASGGPTIIQGSSVFIDDSQDMTGLHSLTLTGIIITGTTVVQITATSGLIRHQAIDPLIAGAGLGVSSGILSVNVTSPLNVAGDNVRHNTSGISPGTFTSVTIDAFGHTTGGTNPVIDISDDTNLAVTSPIVLTDDTLSHATSGVGAGTYTSVTVDTLGHTTGGTNPGHVLGAGTGADDVIAKWTPDGSTIGSSDMTDNGTVVTVVTEDFTVAVGNFRVTSGVVAANLKFADNVQLRLGGSSFGRIYYDSVANDVILGANNRDLMLRDTNANTNWVECKVGGNVFVPLGDLTVTVGNFFVKAGLIKIGNATTVTPGIVANDLVVDFGAVESGMTVVSTGAANWVAADAGSNAAGVLGFDHTTDTWGFDIGGTREVTISDGVVTIDAKGKAGITSIGGFAVKLTNKTGGNTVAGQIVNPSAGTADAFDTGATNSLFLIGVVLEAGVADGEEAWVVTSGIADVLMNGGGAVLNDRIGSGATGGSADVINSPSLAEHFREIGHVIESRVGAGLTRCILHFN